MTLHVYAQPYPHSDCCIIGSEEDLRRLAECILATCDAHMSTGREAEKFFTSDGEGYTLHIARVTDPELDKTRLPYTSEWGSDTRKNVKEAWQYFVRGGGSE